MVDVVEVARRRKSSLAAEIARLDDFIQMAEALMRHGDGTGRRGDGPGGWEPVSLFADNGPGGGKADEDGAEPGGPALDGGSPEAETPKAEAEFGAGAATPETAGKVTVVPAGSADGGEVAAETGTVALKATPAPKEGELLLTDVLAIAESDADPHLDADVGQRLRQRRWMMGMTKRQLAERLDIDVEEIQDYEGGKAHISTSRMWHLAAALEVPMSYFFGEPLEPSPGKDEARAAHAEQPRRTEGTLLARTA